MISGNQKWNGAAPIFINNADLNIMFNHVSMLGIYICLNDIEIIVNKITVEAKTCVIKYLIAVSVASLFFVFLIKGIKERRLISNPIHIPNQV
jgi:hypothetical protein